jgi:hypothetical protein
MYPQQLLARRRRRVHIHQMLQNSGGEQVIFDRSYPRRTLGVMGAHVVQRAVSMVNKGGRHNVGGR